MGPLRLRTLMWLGLTSLVLTCSSSVLLSLLNNAARLDRSYASLQSDLLKWPSRIAHFSEPVDEITEHTKFGWAHTEWSGADRGFDVQGNIIGGAPSVGVVQSGWPWAAFEGYYVNQPTPIITTQYTAKYLIYCRTSDWLGGDWTIIPLRPRLAGLFADMGVWCIVVVAIWSLARGSLVWVRWRRNSCLACGYAKGELHICPECGCQIVKPTAAQL